MSLKPESLIPNNPFQVLLTGLSTTEYTPVTLDLLKYISEIINEPSVVVQTYGEVFQTLEFLGQAGAIELVKDSDTEIFKIRKL